MILPATDLAGAAVCAQRVVDSVARAPLVTGGHVVRATCSAGVAELAAGDTPDTLVTRADEALYAAKAAGRNRVRRAVSA